MSAIASRVWLNGRGPIKLRPHDIKNESPRMRGARAALPFAAVYIGFFLTLGFILPFWPLWLGANGLDAQTIGLALALGSWIQIITTPVFAQLCDRSSNENRVFLVLSVAAPLAVCAILFAKEVWLLVGLHVLINILYTPMMPLSESKTMSASIRFGFDYGRTRIWGSIAVMLGSTVGGSLIALRGTEIIPQIMLLGMGITFLAVLFLPNTSAKKKSGSKPHFLTLFKLKHYIVFLAAVACLQGSHAAFYGFSAIHWDAAGLNGETIGLLWSTGVAAEVLLFGIAAHIQKKLSPTGFLVIAGLGGVLRWTALAFWVDPLILFFLQPLHAVTFGFAHLGAMNFLLKNAPPGLAATAQAVYTALSTGLAIGVMMLVAGWLYENYQGGAFIAMALSSLTGAAIALALPRVARKQDRS